MINPVRLKGTPRNIARYYSVGDYYTKGGDELSQWGGEIAAELGIARARVDATLLRDLLAGKIGGEQLGRRRTSGEVEHHPGWDFAVNAPKSVSIMALVAGDERLFAAHETAVGTALGYLEEHATRRRREEGKIVYETTGRLLWARFTEHASRELDPHLHTHAVVLNMTNDRQGPMTSLETRAMFAEQMAAGQIYRNDLAHRLRELGYALETDPRTGRFEIADVSKALIDSFSQRAQQIDAHAREHGHDGQADRQKSFYATRPAKRKTNLAELGELWRSRSEEQALAMAQAQEAARVRGDRVLDVAPADAARAMLFGIRQAETTEAVNNLGRMIRVALASHVGDVRLGDVRPLAERHERLGKLLVTNQPTGERSHMKGRTTRTTAELERGLSWELALALDDARPVSSADRLLPALERAGLNPAQEQALVQVALSRDRVTAIHGVAGAGKSTLVRVLGAAAEPGTTLIALAPTSSAAANLGDTAGIASRTVASLLASGGHGITEHHVLVLDEAGQLGNRQARRMLELSRVTGARLLLLGDNKQTGAIEQGKAFWLMQRLGMPTAQLTQSVRQETRSMKAAVAHAREGDYEKSLLALDKVVSAATPEELAKGLVQEWTRLAPQSRASTNILVLDNATRLIVNTQIRAVLAREGVIAAEETRLEVLGPAGMSVEEKRNARFYTDGLVVTFGRDNASLGIARETEYRVLGPGRDQHGRQLVRLIDEQGRIIRWDPRLGGVKQVNIFERDERSLAVGDRIQWRLVNKALDLKNAERGTVESLDGTIAMIRWDRTQRRQPIDLLRHKTWDHGYAETVYSAQSKTYARAYVLAPVNAGLVNGQNYYTAITRARYGVKLWTEDPEGLAARLTARSGEKTSALEGLGRLDDAGKDAKPSSPIDTLRKQMLADRSLRSERQQQDRTSNGLADRLASRAQSAAQVLETWLANFLGGSRADEFPKAPTPEPRSVGDASRGKERGHER